MPRPTISPKERRTATLSTAVTPKLKYLAALAAKVEGNTVSDFISDIVEDAIARALRSKGTQWGEGLWDEDKITRICLLGVADHNFLGEADKKIWNDYVNGLAKARKPLKIEEFRKYYEARIKQEGND